MQKKFIKIGNSWAMLFTKTMFEMLEINPEQDNAELEFNKNTLTIKKAIISNAPEFKQ